MSVCTTPLNWQLESSVPYLPIYYQGEIVGFFKKEFAKDVIKFLNEDEVLKKALKTACTDLIKQTTVEPTQVKDLMNKYIKMSERPKYGTRAIAALLRDRQLELDLSQQDFTKFCDTFKVSPIELHNIYAGGPVEDQLLAPLSRIIGISTKDLLEIRDGEETKKVSTDS
ncbi:hypothetical protein [Iningainema tapete]|uniref:Uncharacterized protein n=1 Tax=Iningainema tapete BLCC-T55 TaxID=2748662 RepID=A0A8J6XV22_9CYAN|nr:hypothetical protein [Iningainema tapete]MBD2776632.1 hypothetical protein [Iningainema tapete BLCC-T55]